MRKRSLYASVSVTALSLVAAGMVQAQEIIGDATNNATVTLTTDVALTGVGNIGVGASASINAAGANASVSGVGAGSDFTGIGVDDKAGGVTSSVGSVGLTSSNTAAVTINAGVNVKTADTITVANGGSLGFSALGASSGISFAGIGAGDYTVPTIATGGGEEIKLSSTNAGFINPKETQVQSATGTTETGPELGAGASASISAIGAASSVGLRAVDATSFTASGIGNITTNSASNTGSVFPDNFGKVTVGNVAGYGASVGVGTTGAVASVGTTAIRSSGFEAKFGTINQLASNETGTATRFSDIDTAAVNGIGASVSTSATGAVTSVSETFILDKGNTQSTFGNIIQSAGTTSAAASELDNANVKTGDLSTAASVRLSGSGAGASVSSTAIGPSAAAFASFGTVGQTVNSEGFLFVGSSKSGIRNTATVGGVSGQGASASISASGASGDVGTSLINGTQSVAGSIGAVTQTIDNSGLVLNNGSSLTTGAVSGIAASASISASGASGGVAGSAITGTTVKATAIAAVTTDVGNTGDVTLKMATLDSSAGVGNMAGSAGLSVTGASASASSVNIVSTGGAAANFASVSQVDSTDANKAGVTNTGAVTLTTTGEASLKAGVVGGLAASAQMGASGAVASVGATVIGGGTTSGAEIGAVVQRVDNQTGTISVAGFTVAGNKVDVQATALSGLAASAGISAQGAAASVSGTTIGNSFSPVAGATYTGTVTSVAENKSGVTASNVRVDTGEITGVAASGSISAIGASTSAGATIIGRGEAVTTTTFTGLVTQEAKNTGGGVTVGSGNVTAGGLDSKATAASIGVNAVGASASANSTTINGNSIKAAAGATFTGGVTQAATNTGTIVNTALSVDAGGAIAALGGSASLGAVGASASAGATVISTSSTGATFTGQVKQDVNNTGGAVTITGPGAANDVTVTNLTGTASSAGISAVGATASINSTMLSASGSGSAFTGGGDQNVANTGAVGVKDAKVAPGLISGTAASASLNAIGASASVGASMIGSQGTGATGGAFAQDVSSTTGTVSVAGPNITSTGIDGVAASAGIGASGVSANVSATYIESGDNVTNGVTFGNINQGTDGKLRGVTNASAVSIQNTALAAATLEGPAASASIGASGASAGVSVASIGDTKNIAGSGFGTVGQFVENQAGGAVNVGTDSDNVTLTLTGLKGIADSASISASGASASIGVSEIAGTGLVMGKSSFGAITQDVINAGAITIGKNATIASSGGLAGKAASVSIAASGASASYSIAGIDIAAVMTGVQVASIGQTVVNSAPVSNAGSINLAGGALGIAASAGISATGASTGVSFTAIK